MNYLAFGYIYSHARGGMGDLKGNFDNIEAARIEIEQCAKRENLRDCDYIGQIVSVENETPTIVSRYLAHSSRDGVIDTQQWTDEK